MNTFVNWISNQKYLLGLIISGVIFAVAWYMEGILFRLFALLLVLCAQIIYASKTDDEKGDIFGPVLKWAHPAFTVMAILIYVSALLNEIDRMVILLVSTIGTIFLGLVWWKYTQLMKEKNLFGVCVTYLLLSFSAVALFSYGYAILGAFPGNELIHSNSINGTIVDDIDAWDYMFASATIYYTSPFSGLFPTGWSKLVVVTQLAFTFVLHVIVLGYIISRLKKKKN